MIIPFLLMIDAEQQAQCVENRLSMHYQKTQQELPEDIDGLIRRKVDKYQ